MHVTGIASEVSRGRCNKGKVGGLLQTLARILRTRAADVGSYASLQPQGGFVALLAAWASATEGCHHCVARAAPW